MRRAKEARFFSVPTGDPHPVGAQFSDDRIDRANPGALENLQRHLVALVSAEQARLSAIVPAVEEGDMALPPVARAAPEHGNIAGACVGDIDGHAPFEVAAGGERAGSGKAAFGEHRADECGAPWCFVIGHGHAGVAEIFQHDGIVRRARPFPCSQMAAGGGVQRGAGGLCLAAHEYGLRGDLPGHHSRLSTCHHGSHRRAVPPIHFPPAPETIIAMEAKPIMHLALCTWLEGRFCRSTVEIRSHIASGFGLDYSHSGCIRLLARLGFEYRKPRPLPKLASAEQQASLIALYEPLMTGLGADEAVCFADAVHPEQQTKPAFGRVRKGSNPAVKTTAGRGRVNIHGALIHQHVAHNRHDTTQKQFANAILGFLRETIPNEWKTFPSQVEAKYQTTFASQQSKNMRNFGCSGNRGIHSNRTYELRLINNLQVRAIA